MQLARFQTIVEHLQSHPTLRSEIDSLAVYRFFDGTWFDEANNEIEDAALLTSLHNTLSEGSHWRRRKSAIAYFPISEFDAAIRATYSAPPRSSTRDRHAHMIEECITQARNAFDATHDHLTGLHNLPSFLDRLQQLLPTPAEQGEDSQDTSGVAALFRNPSAFMFAIDIDHFKQVNDNYGHLYGDKVITALARRLEATARALIHDRPNTHMELCRSSGEEFLVFIFGEVDPEDAETLGEAFRYAIAREPLPSDDEWNFLASETDTEIRLPPLVERQIAISVGVCVLPASGSAEPRTFLESLRDRADRALSSAKSGGRDTVRAFHHILLRYGTVLEHHADTGVVIIDVGRDVGVRPGQEFKVFHPQFVGDIPYMVDDGRTRRALGTYPRIPQGRLVTFDVQLDISFCRVEGPGDDTRIASGSSLEAIPLGSIAHLISAGSERTAFATRQVLSEEDLAARADVIQATGTPNAIVFRVGNADDVIEKHGAATFNEALAKLYDVIASSFPATAALGLVDTTSIGVILQDRENDNLVEDANSILQQASEACHALVVFCAGVYDGSTSFALSGDNSTLMPARALSYARIAAEEVDGSNTKVASFSPDSGAELLYKSRSSHRYQTTLQDYQFLSDLGISFWKVHNNAALAAIKVPGKEEFAQETIEKALGLLPDDDEIFRHICIGNAGIIYSRTGDLDQAHSYFSQLPTKFLSSENAVYLVEAAKVAQMMFRTDPTTVDRTTLHDLLVRARDVATDLKWTAIALRLDNGLAWLSEQPAPIDSAQQETTTGQ